MSGVVLNLAETSHDGKIAAVLAWDPDFTKVTSEEAKKISDA
jgi:hypothetical protein